METDAGPGCVRPDVVLLAEFRGWLDREQGLSPVSVRCYSKQSKAFLVGIGGAGAVLPGMREQRMSLFSVAGDAVFDHMVLGELRNASRKVLAKAGIPPGRWAAYARAT